MVNTIFATVPLDEFKQFITQCVKEAMSSSKGDNSQRSNEDVILDMDEAAAYLHCSKSKLYSMTSNNEIPYMYVGRNLLKKSDLDAYLAKSERPSQSQVIAKMMQTVPKKRGMK